jgi:YVTN family beta-propeller protein
MHNVSIFARLTASMVLAAPGLLLAGPRLYVSDTLADNVSVIDTATNTRVGAPIATTQPGPLAPVVSPNGHHVYVQSVNGPIDVIDAATATITRTFDNPNPDATDGAGALTLSADGSKLYATAPGVDSVAVVDTASGSVVAHITPDGAAVKVASMRTSHDGARLYLIDGVDLTITAIDIASSHTIGAVSVEAAGATDELMDATISLDDRTLYAITFYGQLVRVDTDSMTITASDPIGSAKPPVEGAQLYGIALQPDGSHAFVAQSGTACLLDVELGASSAASGTSIADNNACLSVAAGRDGKHAYMGTYDISSETYSVVALDPADDAAPTQITGFSYVNFDDQSIDRSATTLTPRAGIWWTPGLPGSSFQIEVQNGTLIVVASSYDNDGAPTWRMASGPFDAQNGTFESDFVRYTGSCLGCAYRAPTGSTTNGSDVTIAFSSVTGGTLTFGGQTIPIAKYTW